MSVRMKVRLGTSNGS
ncbi:hypothetical protein MTR67_052783 [Solanum verrucosum]|uniref:Uncharacterized protein n=1 Tax=Solanum verrucosum TaxID=315347 RepID=A0AAF0V9R6_SOLVR|nr:hypothetical protein MTR67_052783 [Solanum verrucosum]